MTDLAVKNFLARSICNIEFKSFSKALALPHCERFCMLLIVAVSDECKTNSKGICHVTDERREEVVARCRCGTDHDGAEGFFCKVSLSNVSNKPDYADDLAVRVSMRSEGTGFPNVVSVRSMFGDQGIRNLDDFAGQGALESRLDAARN